MVQMFSLAKWFITDYALLIHQNSLFSGTICLNQWNISVNNEFILLINIFYSIKKLLNAIFTGEVAYRTIKRPKNVNNLIIFWFWAIYELT